MNTDTIDVVAMDRSLAKIETPDAAKTFIQSVISEFREKYTIEDPNNVRQTIRPVLHALRGLQKKGFNMRPFCEQLIADAAKDFELYKGDKDLFAYQSTLIVADHVMHKHGTGYWKREDKKET